MDSILPVPNRDFTRDGKEFVKVLADTMVGYWCRVGSPAFTHTHNDVAILAQVANIAQHLFVVSLVLLSRMFSRFFCALSLLMFGQDVQLSTVAVRAS